MKKRSNLFTIGQRVNGTLFTIVDSVEPTNWHDIICLCDCGNKVVLAYHKVYYKQYSCGCRRRPRVDSVDYTSTEALNGNGNAKRGRKLTVVLFDELKQQWQYMCDCCSEIFFVPRGNERGLTRTLRDLAGQTCPNWREPWYIYKDRRPEDQYIWLYQHGVRISYHDPKAPLGWCEVPSHMPEIARLVVLNVPYDLARTERRKRGGLIEYSLAHFLIPYYDPKHVIWEGRPKVLAGFKGMPTVPAKLPLYVRGEGVTDGAEPNVIEPDPDGFAEFSELTGVGDVEQQEP